VNGAARPSEHCSKQSSDSPMPSQRNAFRYRDVRLQSRSFACKNPRGDHASWNGERLREPHCAVDPKKVPYGSKVVFPDAECLTVDSGPDVVNRKAARSCGRNAAERNAIVIDRFFDTKEKALA
jgi:hypothetical protein